MNKKGFTLIEALLSVALISVVGIVGSRSLLNVSRSSATQAKNSKASALAEMVFQQYNSYAAQNYQLLNNYDVTNETPAAFFHKTDNFGYDNVLITTLAQYGADRSTATITVGLTWVQGGVYRSSATFVKMYTESAQRAGGAVDLYIRIPCNSLTDPDLIYAQCPGVAGFSILAPTFNGTNAPVITDAAGHALLGNVALGAAVQIQVTAPAPSTYTIPSGSPNFVQGYYAVDAGNYVLSKKIATSVVAGTLNRMIVVDFAAAGTVTGSAQNDSAVTPLPTMDGLVVEIQNGFAATDAGYASCASIPPCVVSTQNGRYTFSNVIPSPTSLVIQGRVGSDPIVQPSDPSFKWSMIAAPGYAYDITAADWAMQTPPTITKDVHFVVLGWLELTTVFKNDPSTVFPNFPILYNEEAPSPGDMHFPWGGYVVGNTDAQGKLKLYNVLYSAGDMQLFFDSSKAPSGTDNGGHLAYWATGVQVGVANVITLPVQAGYELRGYIHDDNPNANFANNLGMNGWGITNTTTDPLNGYFDYKGFFPTMDQWADPLMGDPQVPFPSAVNFSAGSHMNTVQLQINTIDSATGQRAPNASVWVWGGTQPDQLFTSDSNGAITVSSVQVPFFAGLWANIVCDNNTMLCSMCQQTATCSAASAQTYNIDSRNTSVLFNPTQYNVLTSGYHYNNQQYLSTDPATGIVTGSINEVLNVQMVQGTVLDAYGHPVSGIQIIFDQAMNSSAYSDGLGHYGPVFAPVLNRGPGQPGNVLLVVGAQQGYDNTSVAPPEPAQPDAMTPLTVNIPLTGGPPSGGGI